MDKPLPFQMPGTRWVGLPPQFHGHPLLSTGPYFTLPGRLLDQVVTEVGKSRFDADLLAMELALSEVCGDHSSLIGFWREQPIRFLHLRPKNDLVDDFFVQGMVEFGASEGMARETLATLGRRLDWAAEVRRGYSGWLMTNRTFLEEHRLVFQNWADEVAHNGIPSMGPVVRDAQAVPDSQLGQGRLEQYVRAFEDFFIRWRIDD